MPGANQEPVSENEAVSLGWARAFGGAGREQVAATRSTEPAVVDAPIDERAAPAPGDPWTRYLEEALDQQAGEEFVGAPHREGPFDLSRSVFEPRADLTTTMRGSTGPEREGAGAQVGQGSDCDRFCCLSGSRSSKPSPGSTPCAA
jgi:hypothetical protein